MYYLMLTKRFFTTEGIEFVEGNIIRHHEVIKDDSERKVFSFQKAEFPGGFEALSEFIEQNKVYPPEALANRIEGKVVVEYFVEADGTVNEIIIVESVHPLLDAEAIRIISILPQWQPAIMTGEPVRQRFGQTIRFTLEE